MAREPKPQTPQTDWSHPLSRGLVGAWPMWEGGGDTVRDVARGSNGTISGASWATKQYGHTLTLDGVNDYATVADRSDLNPEHISISVIARSTHVTSGTWQEFICLKSFTSHIPPYYQYGIGVIQGGVVTAALSIGGSYISCSTATGVITQNEWFSATMTFDGSTLRLYVDGALSASLAVSGTINSYATDVHFGRHGNLPATADYCFDGDIADVRIWSRALPDSAIRDLYVSPWEQYTRPLLGVGNIGNAYAVLGGAARAPASLSITTQPSGAVSGSPFTTQPVVKLLDASGAVVTGDSSSTVTATIATGAGTLQGTTTVTLSSGVATFTDLRIDEEVAFTLSFSTSAGSFSATSSSFTVTEAATAGFSDLLALTSGLLSVPPLAATAGYKSVMSMCGVYIDSAGEPLPSGGGGKPVRMRRRRIPMVLFDDAEDGIVLNAALDSFGAIGE